MRVKALATSLALVVGLLSIFAYQYYNEDTTDFELARAASAGQYLDLKLGITRYKVFGNEGDPTVVLVHSFNGYIESWNPNIEPLVQAGYRVVAYDLWGRGFSDRPRVDLTLDVFRKQLHDILEHLNIKATSLVGSSFGCVLVSDYALHYPDAVQKLVLVGPAGWPQEDDSASPVLSMPIVGDMLFHYFGQSFLKSIVDQYFYNKEGHEWAVDEWTKFAGYPGFTRSALSTLRNSPVSDYTDGWRALGESKKPTLFIWGKEDVSFPYANTEKVAKLIPHAEIAAVEHAAHWVNIEKAAAVNEAMISFLGD